MTKSNKVNDQLSKEIAEETEAGKLLNAIGGHFVAMRAQIFGEFSSSNFDESELREECYRQLNSLDRFEARLLTSIQTGKMARKQIENINKNTH